MRTYVGNVEKYVLKCCIVSGIIFGFVNCRPARQSGQTAPGYDREFLEACCDQLDTLKGPLYGGSSFPAGWVLAGITSKDPGCAPRNSSATAGSKCVFQNLANKKSGTRLSVDCSQATPSGWTREEVPPLSAEDSTKCYITKQ